jgi:hypothetical protein
MECGQGRNDNTVGEEGGAAMDSIECYPLFTTAKIRIMNQSRIRLVVLVISCVPFAVIAQQPRHQLSVAEKEHTLDGRFEVVSTTEGLPANIRQAFSEVTREPSFALANPGEKYQVTDVVIDRSLPFRRLVFAGRRDGDWLVYYERGGRGHGYYVLVFKVDPHGDAHFIWGGSGPNGAKNLGHLRKMVAAGHFSDEGSYW